MLVYLIARGIGERARLLVPRSSFYKLIRLLCSVTWYFYTLCTVSRWKRQWGSRKRYRFLERASLLWYVAIIPDTFAKNSNIPSIRKRLVSEQWSTETRSCLRNRNKRGDTTIAWRTSYVRTYLHTKGKKMTRCEREWWMMSLDDVVDDREACIIYLFPLPSPPHSTCISRIRSPLSFSFCSQRSSVDNPFRISIRSILCTTI